MGAKKQKLLAQYTEQASCENSEGGLFSGVAIFVNGWTRPSSDELKRMMMSHGGVYHHYQSHATTHIIASNLPDVKVRALRGDEMIVRPEWIVESVSAGRLLDPAPFLLYTHANKHQPRLSFRPAAPAPAAAGASDQAAVISSAGPRPGGDANKENYNTKWVAKDATDTRFLGEFFSNSRLHHIATMAATAKDYVSSLRAEHGGTFPARASLAQLRGTGAHEGGGRTIMHIDMDCFFVSVGLVSRPELRGRPVVVTHARGNKQSQGRDQDREQTERRRRELDQYQEKVGAGAASWKLENIEGTSSMSEIASCSYEARARGVRNGMFLGPALKLCPDLVPIPYDFSGYEAVSRALYDTVASYTLDIMAVSCDEMFVDLTSLCRDLGMDPMAFVQKLRDQIFAMTGCPCSVGLGPNILLSRLATKKAKPNGQFLLREDCAGDILAELKASELPGVGRSLEHKLVALGVATVGDLVKVSLDKLQKELGHKTGASLYNMARGRDDRELELDHVRKTISAEVNYGIRFKTAAEAEQFLAQLSEEVAARMARLGLLGRTVTLKLMVRAADAPEETAKYNGHGVCDNLSRSVTLASATCSPQAICKEVTSLMKTLGAKPGDLRGIGITVSKLEPKAANKTIANNSILKFVRPNTKQDNTNMSVQSDSSKPDPNDDNDEDDNEVRSDTTVQKTNDISNFLDVNILNELPPDIRAEVEAEYNINQPSTSGQMSRHASPLKPSTSTVLLHNDTDGEASNQNSNSCDISFSQVDQDVLSELPPELQLELNRHFAGLDRDKEARDRVQPKTSVQVKSITAFDAIMNVQNTSPSKPAKGKRGRPKKGTTNVKGALKAASPRNVAAKATVSGGNIDLEDNSSVDLDVLAALPDDIKAEVESQMKRNEAKNNRNASEKPTAPPQPITEYPAATETPDTATASEVVVSGSNSEDGTPSFCGKTSIEEIRPLLKEWIKSADRPQFEDVNMLSDFLKELIKSWRMDVVQILLRTLHRNIDKLAPDMSADWRQAWSHLLVEVQNVMLMFYGNPLLVKESF